MYMLVHMYDRRSLLAKKKNAGVCTVSFPGYVQPGNETRIDYYTCFYIPYSNSTYGKKNNYVVTLRQIGFIINFLHKIRSYIA